MWGTVIVVDDRGDVVVLVLDVGAGCVVLVRVVEVGGCVVLGLDVVVVVEVVVVVRLQWSVPSQTPPVHGVPAAANRQAAVQHDACVPSAAPSSHASPPCTIRSPQPGIATSVTLLPRFASGSTFFGSIVTRSRKARVLIPGTAVASMYWQARDGP